MEVTLNITRSMRLILLNVFCLLIISCSSSKPFSITGIPGKKTLKGTWEVTDIRFIGEAGIYKAKIFDIADSPCFKGSQWVFIPNNGTGKFTVNESNNCYSITQRILWSYFESEEDLHLQFKKVNEKNKPLSEDGVGYRMLLKDLSSSEMETRIQTSEGGKPFEVVLTFQKVSENITL